MHEHNLSCHGNIHKYDSLHVTMDTNKNLYTCTGTCKRMTSPFRDIHNIWTLHPHKVLHRSPVYISMEASGKG